MRLTPALMVEHVQIRSHHFHVPVIRVTLEAHALKQVNVKCVTISLSNLKNAGLLCVLELQNVKIIFYLTCTSLFPDSTKTLTCKGETTDCFLSQVTTDHAHWTIHSVTKQCHFQSKLTFISDVLRNN